MPMCPINVPQGKSGFDRVAVAAEDEDEEDMSANDEEEREDEEGVARVCAV